MNIRDKRIIIRDRSDRCCPTEQELEAQLCAYMTVTTPADPTFFEEPDQEIVKASCLSTIFYDESLSISKPSLPECLSPEIIQKFWQDIFKVAVPVVPIWVKPIDSKWMFGSPSPAMGRINTVNHLYELTRDVEWQIGTYFSEISESQQENFIGLLIEKKLLKPELDFINLKKEVGLRRKQYPGSNIFIFMGESHLSYYINLGIIKDPYYLFGARVFQVSDYWVNNHLDHTLRSEDYSFSTAVVARDQVSMKHEIETAYSYSKVKRGWRVLLLGAYFLKIEYNEPYITETTNTPLLDLIKEKRDETNSE